ncbi:MAG TPA: DUF1385 domain-containing protein [Candidatus Angelobacter sp.]|jgi:uncharacterized protein YqhQ|nr:DUF1385 domain-containing protein [Candidatus Angelobacter sp.]
MSKFRHFLRLFAVQQLLPALEANQEALIGGQAVLEGVMMRSPHAWGIAVRKPSGDIATHCEPLQRPSEKRKWLAWPFVRGLVTLGQAMNLGYRALKFSANVALAALSSAENQEAEKQERAASTSTPQEDAKPPEMSSWMIVMNMVVGIGFFIFMYKFVPLVAANQLKHSWSALNNNFLFNLVDGAIRIGLFLLFIWGISLWADIHRLYEYHGAEHKTVFAYEAQKDIPSIEFTQKFSTYHPRCGTSFLVTIMLISIFIYAAIPVTSFWPRFGLRVLLLPVIASVSYEMIRFSAKHGRSLFALMTRPGLWTQRITTKQPSNDQVECAIKALDEAMILEKNHGGELVIA